MVLQQLGGQSYNDGMWWHLEVYECRATNKLYSKRFTRGRHGLTREVAYLDEFCRTPQPLSYTARSQWKPMKTRARQRNPTTQMLHLSWVSNSCHCRRHYPMKSFGNEKYKKRTIDPIGDVVAQGRRSLAAQIALTATSFPAHCSCSLGRAAKQGAFPERENCSRLTVMPQRTRGKGCLYRHGRRPELALIRLRSVGRQYTPSL